MRKTMMALALSLGVTGMSPVAHAVSPYEDAPEYKAYVNFEFGGAADLPAMPLRYGLRIDHDSRYLRTLGNTMPPLAQLQFSDGRFESASVNGLPFARSLSLQQYGTEETRWTAIDWGLLAAGVVGLGFVVYEISDANDESPDPAPAQ